MTNLQKRISSGLVLLVILTVIIITTSSIPDLPIYTLAILALLVSYEYSRFFKTKSLSLVFLLTILISTLVPSVYYSYFVIFGCLIWLSLFLRILLYDNPTMGSAEIFFSGYLMIFPSFVSGIIIFETYGKLLILILIAVSFADSAAYFSGKKFGSKILLKNTSPGKTLEGLIGAFIA
ncbi:MAG: phosphatidate cytidylyltransferase, partial [Pseudomonadota bacterium]|nr:phosphatidate cytidylyltransferase [Pseudomonadota bacterium]